MKNFVKLLLILFLPNFLFSSLFFHDNLEKYILKTFDINELFLQDLKYIDMKKTKRKYHLTIKSKNEKFVTVVKNIIKDDPSVPLTVLYLAMAESKFDLRAKSWVKAGGVWQFMPRTAEKFGLKIDMYVDERYDIENSTKAAISYLKYLHKMFDKWYLALMAYNCGEGRLKRVIKQTGSDDLMRLLSSKTLPFETKMHIRKIVAMAYINYKNYLGTPEISKIETKGGLSLYAIARNIKMGIRELKSINPHLKHSFLPPYENYHIYLPTNKIGTFLKQFKEDSKTKYYVYTVQSGDNLRSIALKYKTNYKIIKDFNDIKNDMIYVGQKLTIPTLNVYTKYKIKSGDTLANISKKYNIKLDILMKVNSLTNGIIIPGDEIVIPNS